MARTPSQSASSESSSPWRNSSSTTVVWPKRCSPKKTSTASLASLSVSQTITPFPAASTSAFSTAGYGAHGRWASASSRVRNRTWEAVGTLFEPSILAAAAEGPNARTPASPSMSTRPPTSGASGPTTTNWTSRSNAAATIAFRSSAATGRHSTPSRATPALPGAASSSGSWGLRVSARTSACSRPPEPTTRTRLKSAALRRAATAVAAHCAAITAAAHRAAMNSSIGIAASDS